MGKITKQLALTGGIVVLSACATATKDNPDPYESYNRAMFSFNQYTYDYVFDPVTDVYAFIFPTPVRHGIGNFFNNIFEVPHVINDILQLDFVNAGNDAGRFVINTVFGFAGFVDVARTIGLEPHIQTFGLTLASWGWEDSTYVVLPFLGPSTIRDTVSYIPDIYFNPITYVAGPTIFLAGYSGFGLISDGVAWGVTGAYALNEASIYLPFYYNATEFAIDPYIAVRDGYMQYKQNQIKKLQQGAFEPQLN